MDQVNGIIRKIPANTLYIAGVLPFVWLVVQLFTGGLGVDPVKSLEHQLGKIGLQFLLAGLLVTPLRRLFGLNLIKFRRALGLLAFFYILLHLSVWLLLDIQLRWSEIWTDILKRPYITIGMAGFLLLLPLAMTSNNWSVKRMGAMAWRNLHKITYPAVAMGALHYVLVVKSWQIEPLVYLFAVLMLLVIRIRKKRRVSTA